MDVSLPMIWLFERHGEVKGVIEFLTSGTMLIYFKERLLVIHANRTE